MVVIESEEIHDWTIHHAKKFSAHRKISSHGPQKANLDLVSNKGGVFFNQPPFAVWRNELQKYMGWTYILVCWFVFKRNKQPTLWNGWWKNKDGWTQEVVLQVLILINNSAIQHQNTVENKCLGSIWEIKTFLKMVMIYKPSTLKVLSGILLAAHHKTSQATWFPECISKIFQAVFFPPLSPLTCTRRE